MDREREIENENKSRWESLASYCGFGSGYILEYNTGTLAVTEPREPYIEGRKTNLFLPSGHNSVCIPKCISHFDFCKDETLDIIIGRDMKSRFYKRLLIEISCFIWIPLYKTL